MKRIWLFLLSLSSTYHVQAATYFTIPVKLVGSVVNPSSPDVQASAPDVKPSGPDQNPSAPDLKQSAPDVNPRAPDVKLSETDVKLSRADVKLSGPDQNPSAADEKPSGPDVTLSAAGVNPSAPDVKPSGPDVNPSAKDDKLTDPIITSPNSTTSKSSITESLKTNNPDPKSSTTNTPISTSSSDTRKRKGVKPHFGVVGTQDFFKMLETPMIYRPPPVFIGPFHTTTISPYLNPLRRNANSILCQDFVTPVLTAAIRNLTYPFIVTSKDHFISRLLRILHTDTATATEDDVKTIVWQVSNFDIRLYQWSALAMSKMLNTITLHSDEDHWTLEPKLRSFGQLKKELESILMSWRLDLSDKEPILRDSKIIRPPCCCGNTLGQSTYGPTVTVITSKAPTTTKNIGRMGPEEDVTAAGEEVEYEDDSIETPSPAPLDAPKTQ